MNQKTILYTGITVVALALAYFLFTTPNKDANNSVGEGDVSSLDGGKHRFQGGKEALSSERNESSLFDSENGFLDFSNIEEVEKNSEPTPGKYDPAGISPEERARRRELVIEKYSELAKQFPNNRYVPRKYSKEEQEIIEKRSANMNYLQERIFANDSLSANERAYFYHNKKQESKEKLELIEYASKKLQSAEALSDSSNDLIAKRLQSIQQRLSVYDKEYATAVEEGGTEKDFD